jgi:hypothetical protein
MTKKFKPLERVQVPWGLGTASGKFLRAYGPPGHPFALIQLDDEDSDEEPVTVSIPLSEVQPAECVRSG